MAAGAVWMVLAKLAERSLGLISMLILARLLVPQDFGIVAMAMSFVALLEMLSAFGFEVALIQSQTKDRGHWDTAWTFNVLIGVAIAVGMIVFATPVAVFFDEPALVDILWVLAIGSAAQGLQNIGLVAFRTEMQFDKEFRFLTMKRVLGFVVTIPLAFILESYWALVIGQTFGRVASTALSYWIHPYRPRFSLVASGALFHFSKWMFALNIIAYLRDRSANWVIGRVAGPAALGAFTISYELATLPSSELVAPINRAVFPAYARLAKEGIEPLRREYLSVIGFIVLLATPAVFGMAATASVLVPVMLGEKWMEAVPVLTLLAIFGYSFIIQSNAQAAYLALGRLDVPAKVNIAHTTLQLIALIPLTLQYGAVGAAVAYLATAAIMIPVSLGVVLRMLEIRTMTFIREVWRPIVAATAMYLGVTCFLAPFPTHTTSASALLALIGAVSLGAFIYLASVLLLWVVCGRPEGAEASVLSRAAIYAKRLPFRGNQPNA